MTNTATVEVGRHAAHRVPRSRKRLSRLEVLGYLGAAPVAAAGLLLSTWRVGAGSILMIGLLLAVASPRARRGSRS